MTIRYDRPVSHAAHFSRRIGQFSLLLFVVVLSAHRFSLMPTPYCVALVLLSAAFALLAVLLALIGLNSLWQIAARGGGAAAAGLFYALAPIALVAWGAYDYVRYPPIYDITTDIGDPPPFLDPVKADQIWLPRNTVITDSDRLQQLSAYPGLIGRRYNGALDRVFEAVEKVNARSRIKIRHGDGLEKTEADIADLPAKPAGAEEEAVPDTLDNVPVPLPRPNIATDLPLIGQQGDVLLQGETRSLILGFSLDVVIRLREEAETTLVDIRVVSRYGQHDLGYGETIADDYLKALDAELLGISGG